MIAASAPFPSPAPRAAGAGPRILVVRTRFVGDTVLAIPFLRNLRRAFPDATIDVLVERASGAVLADCPHLDGLVVAPRVGEGRESALATVRANARWLARRRYDRAYVLKRSLSAILQTRLAGIPHRVGFASQGGSPFLSRAVPLRPHRHEVELFLDLLRADGLPVDDGRNENWVAPELADRVDALLGTLPEDRPRVFVAPRSTAVEKEWPVERMARTVAWLVETRGCEVLFCGAPRDVAVHAEIRERSGAGAHVHDVTPHFDLRGTSALLSRMDLCLGIDTGLLHVAASHGVPVVALFGPTDPNQWRPWGTSVEVIRSARVERGGWDSLRDRLFPDRVAGLRWPAGAARMEDVGEADVRDAIARLLPARRPELSRAG